MHQITATLVQDRLAGLKADAQLARNARVAAAAGKRGQRYPLMFNRFRLAVPANSRREARGATQVAA